MKLPVVLVFVLLALAACDGATCPENWVLNMESCYLFVDEYVSWSTAQEICRVVDARLLEVEDAQENTFITSKMADNSLSNVWLGMHDFVREGAYWSIVNKGPATYFNWAPGEPNNMNTNDHAEGGEDCVQMRGNGQWDDYWCDDTHVNAVVCEMPMLDEEVVG